MTGTQDRIPITVYVVCCGVALVGLFIAFGFFAQPEKLLVGLDLANPQIERLAQSLGARSLTMAVAMIVAMFLRSRPALIAVLVMRIITELLDVGNAYAHHAASGQLIIGTVMAVLEIAALLLLLRSVRKTEA